MTIVPMTFYSLCCQRKFLKFVKAFDTEPVLSLIQYVSDMSQSGNRLPIPNERIVPCFRTSIYAAIPSDNNELDCKSIIFIHC